MHQQYSWVPPVKLGDDLSDLKGWEEGRLLLIDKPIDWTSFDLVNKSKLALRSGLNIKKIKIGHAGTLDPKATGLMILLTGSFTKMTDYIHSFNKTYEASFCLGATTPCFDTERPVDAHYPTEHITDELIDTTRLKFIGRISQYPPAYSAVKIDGKTAYKSAHKGKMVVTRPREVEVFDFMIREIEMPYIRVMIRCSSGTYIRSIADDFGKALGSGAYLAGLCRTAIGPWSIDAAFTINDFADKIHALHSKDVMLK